MTERICSWCGRDIIGEVFASAEYGPLIWGDGEVEIELLGVVTMVFCCAGCQWAEEVGMHRLFGMDGKATREHLIKTHGISPGKPGGPQCVESVNRGLKVAKAVLECVGAVQGERNEN